MERGAVRQVHGSVAQTLQQAFRRPLCRFAVRHLHQCQELFTAKAEQWLTSPAMTTQQVRNML